MARWACSADDLRAAAGVVGRMAHRTPLATCATLDARAGRELLFKCEHLQRGGAFKFRGASFALSRLDDATASRGVVTHSSGNHAQALALAARLRGVPAHVVMPRTALAVKRQAVADYGARVILCEPNLAAREATAAQVLAETGGTMIPPYNHPDIIAGQGTCGLEIFEQAPDVDAIVAPIGGGGLVAGLALAAHYFRPGVRVYAAEPAGADDAYRSRQAGQFIPQTNPQTVADGLMTSMGELTWPVVRELVADVIRVEEADVVSAMRLTWERAKLMIEPSSAVAVAAVLSERFRQEKGLGRVAVVLSGGNVNLDRLPWQAA